MPEASSFLLPLPLDIEAVLESLLPPGVRAMAFRARSGAAGTYVAELIRAEALRNPGERAKVKVAPPPKARAEKGFYDAPVEIVERKAAAARVVLPLNPPGNHERRMPRVAKKDDDVLAALHKASETAPPPRGASRLGRGRVVFDEDEEVPPPPAGGPPNRRR